MPNRENVKSTPANIASATNAIATVTFSAVLTGTWRINYLFYCVWSYSAAPTGGRLYVNDGGDTIFDVDVTAAGPGAMQLPPLRGTAGNAMTVNLAAGGATIVGKLNAYEIAF